ncbi:hypothetical protein BST81_19815 [Leptolyngbya sp. 'hensonii']|uniref:hypothetical protein n=1 Tax=Leptolyngbya sp. 'hensonii' TaxID=1922337 RepID=UPI00094FFE5F|nr:hypothetical protein [Leptolyngbya sp. 'hensonii']OLP16687.1 hypothetical protein BST81_19815 [Leptolyngbya sp. 'hensonii']
MTSWYLVPDDVKRLLTLAAEQWEDTAASEAYVNQALAIAGDNPDVLISAYRYFFYKRQDRSALQVALKVIEQVRAVEHLPDLWENLKPILLQRKEDPQIRLYLNAYAASGLILARLGEVEKAKEIATQVNEIDDRKEFGAAVVLNILTPSLDEDE